MHTDAVHAPLPGDIGTIGMLLAYILKKPLFVRYCGNWLVQATLAERFWKWFLETVAGGRNVCLATGGLPEPPSRRNPELKWIFATALAEGELQKCSTERRDFHNHPCRLIIACRQEKEKGTGIVIESLKLLQNDFPSLTLDVVGTGGALGSFQRQAASLGLSDKIVFHNQVSHSRVIELLKKADLFCFPTTSSEGFPKAVLEAMACGLPIVTTKVSVLPELVGDGCGILMDEATATATATAIKKCLFDVDLYQSMSREAVLRAKKYSLEEWRDTIGRLLESAWGPLRTNA